MSVISRLLTFSLTIFVAVPALADFDVVECLSNRSKAECTREMLIQDALSKPLSPGDEVVATSGQYSITVQGEGWLRNGWGGDKTKAKDLGLQKDSGMGRIDFEPSDLAEADFESAITTEMQGIYSGLQKGFRKGKIDISSTSELELLPLTIAGGSGLLGRFCYKIEAGTRKSACVYDGYISDGAKSYKFLGSVGDFDNMRADMEAIITSFTFRK